MNPRQLIVLIRRTIVGTVTYAPPSELSFRYESTWRDSVLSFPLSVSLPIAHAEHVGPNVEAFLWGLMPDNEVVLERWGRQYQASPKSVFALLEHVGEECAGAAQFARPERVESLLSSASHDKVDSLERSDIAERLRELRQDPSRGRRRSDHGQFSLAGAQPKTAFLRHMDRWGIPEGQIPTTHIIKPVNHLLEGQIENEHFCLTLARQLGLPVARSWIEDFGSERAIVIERYDRVIPTPTCRPDEIERVHQEDFCQALGILPDLKYQSGGGPTPKAIAELIGRESSAPAQDLDHFIDALAYNWLIAGTDAHAKNYSILHGARQTLRLAPLYDIASFLPYDDDPQRTKLAMKIGGQYRLRDVRLRQWEKLAEEFDVPTAHVVDRVTSLAADASQLLIDVAEAIQQQTDHPVIGKLASLLKDRIKDCEARLRS